MVAYSAAKAAVINFTKFLAREWATRGIRVNAISPGFFPAEQNRALLFKDDGSYTERGAQIIGHTPMARFGQAHELSGAVVWLAAPKASSFVTGQNIVVDGGFLFNHNLARTKPDESLTATDLEFHQMTGRTPVDTETQQRSLPQPVN